MSELVFHFRFKGFFFSSGFLLFRYEFSLDAFRLFEVLLNRIPTLVQNPEDRSGYEITNDAEKDTNIHEVNDDTVQIDTDLIENFHKKMKLVLRNEQDDEGDHETVDTG